MPRDSAIELTGKVLESLPNALFRVELANGHRLLAHLASKLQNESIPVLPGNEVLLEVSPYDLSRGRITSPAVIARS